ncbi:hypothetical protein E1I69_23595 [Bacillus timonensis]|uniref:Uncharacterized protein n=1 Tax=Bacillus timonensis TaxID=1033734 RepID=A0A4V3V6X9_9BACI|nr:hypothetical protein [Bacillus timonensis]THE09133.1 hypothetical protein E1I69_23595 [Bacillus timonensis]
MGSVFNKTIRFLTVMFIVFSLFVGGQYFYIKNLYTIPHHVVELILEEARNNEKESSYILEENKWASIKAASVFENVREPINWHEFKDFVQQCKFELTYDNGEATYEMMKERYKDTYRYVGVVCFEYDPENGQELGVRGSFTLLVEYIDRSWTVVGVGKKEEEMK